VVDLELKALGLLIFMAVVLILRGVIEAIIGFGVTN